MSAPSTVSWGGRYFRALPLLLSWWRHSLTPFGKAIVLLLSLSLPGLAFYEFGVFQWFDGFLFFAIAAGIVSAVFRPVLAIQAAFPDAVAAGDRFEVALHIENQGTRWAYDLSVSLADAAGSFTLVNPPPRLAIAPGETHDLLLTVQANHRGVFDQPAIVIASTFPFYFMRQQQRSQSRAELVVHPRFASLEEFDLTSVGKSAYGEFLENATSSGENGEFAGNQEYRTGMHVRRWDYPRWARLGVPIVREFQETTRLSCALYVNTFVADNDMHSPDAIEPVISQAAAIVDALDRRQLHPELLVVGDLVLPIDSSQVNVRREIFRALAAAKPIPAGRHAEVVREIASLEFAPAGWLVVTRPGVEEKSAICELLSAAPQNQLTFVVESNTAGHLVSSHQTELAT